MKIIKHCAKCNKPFTTTDDSVVLCRACANESEKAEAAAELARQNEVVESIQCEGCGKTFDFTVGEKEFYESHDLKNLPRFCPECRKTIREMKKKLGGDTATCKECGKPFFYSAQYLLACARNGWDPSPRCPACRAKNARRIEDVRRHAVAETATCKDCGKEFTISVGEMEFFMEKYGNAPVRCRDCRRKRRVNALVKDMRAEAREAEHDTVPAMTDEQLDDVAAAPDTDILMPPVAAPDTAPAQPEEAAAPALDTPVEETAVPAAAEQGTDTADAAPAVEAEAPAAEADDGAVPTAEEAAEAELAAVAAEDDDVPTADEAEEAEMAAVAAEIAAEDKDVPDPDSTDPAPKAEELFQPVADASAMPAATPAADAEVRVRIGAGVVVMAEDDTYIPDDQMPAGPAPKAEELFQPVNVDEAMATAAETLSPVSQDSDTVEDETPPAAAE